MPVSLQSSSVKTAVYICGDANIFFPALVAFASFRKNNSDAYDLYMCFDAESLTDSMRRTLYQYNIQFLDAKTVSGYDMVLQMEKMYEGRWPLEVYLNWCLPEYFLEKGYSLSVKLDYDVLCLGKIDDFLPKKIDGFFCSFLKTKINPYIPDKAMDAISFETGLQETRKFSVNTGVGVLNNEYCKNIKFYKTLFKVVHALNRFCPNIDTLEQAAVALIISNYQQAFVPMKSRLNQRTLTFISDDDLNAKNFSPDVVIIHYLSKYKPWLPLYPKDTKVLAVINASILPFYRNLWLEFAETVEGFTDFCDQRPYNAMELIGVASVSLVNSRKFGKNTATKPMRFFIKSLKKLHHIYHVVRKMLR